jgi:IclR family KDG regulon transcriptional repressor
MNKNIVKSAERTLSVLELFRQKRTPLTASEICKILEYPKSSADALLKTLVNLGYIALDLQTMRYFPSLEVAKLGEWIPSMVLGGGETLEMLEELHQETGETITLSMPTGLSMVFITVVQGTFPMSLTIRENVAVPIFTTAVGFAQLATRSDADIEKLSKRVYRGASDQEQEVDLRELMFEIKKTREAGYAKAYDRVLADTGAIAMALPVNELDQALVVAVGGLSARMKKNESKITEVMQRLVRAQQRFMD